MTANNSIQIDLLIESTMQRKNKRNSPGLKKRKLQRHKSNHRRLHKRNKRKRPNHREQSQLLLPHLIGHKIGVIVASRLTGLEAQKVHPLIHVNIQLKLPRLSDHLHQSWWAKLYGIALTLHWLPKRPKSKRKRRMKENRRLQLMALSISKIWSRKGKKNNSKIELQLAQ